MAKAKSPKVSAATVKHIQELYKQKKAEFEALKVENAGLAEQIASLQEEKATNERELEVLQGKYREANRTISMLEALLDASKRKFEYLQKHTEALETDLLYLREAERQPGVIDPLGTARGRAFQSYLTFNLLEQDECIKYGKLFDKMLAPLDEKEREEFFSLMSYYLRYYREVMRRRMGPQQELIMAEYQLVRLEKPRRVEIPMVDVAEDLTRRQEGKIGQVTELRPPTSEVLPPVDARSDDQVLGVNPLMEEKKRLERTIHAQFNPVVEASEREQFYAKAQRLFELCDKLELVVTADAPEPYEYLPFEVANRLYCLYSAAVKRQNERERAVEYLSKFPA